MMPYIKQDERTRFDNIIEAIPVPMTAGGLNYVITRIIHEYVANKYDYQGMNDVIGVLDAASKEFYRRVVAPYEDQKIQQNGDVGLRISNR